MPLLLVIGLLPPRGLDSDPAYSMKNADIGELLLHQNGRVPVIPLSNITGPAGTKQGQLLSICSLSKSPRVVAELSPVDLL